MTEIQLVTIRNLFCRASNLYSYKTITKYFYP